MKVQRVKKTVLKNKVGRSALSYYEKYGTDIKIHKTVTRWMYQIKILVMRCYLLRSMREK